MTLAGRGTPVPAQILTEGLKIQTAVVRGSAVNPRRGRETAAEQGLVYCANGHRVRRRNHLLARPGSLSLRPRPGRAES